MTVPFNGFYRIGAGYRVVPVCSECGDDILVAYTMMDGDPVCAVCTLPDSQVREAIRARQQRSRRETPGLLSLRIEAPAEAPEPSRKTITRRPRVATSA